MMRVDNIPLLDPLCIRVFIYTIVDAYIIIIMWILLMVFFLAQHFFFLELTAVSFFIPQIFKCIN